MAELTEDAPQHRVDVRMGFTRNLGNFESLKMDVGLAIDGKPGENPQQTFDKVAAWVEKQLVARFQKVTQELGV